MSSPSEAAMRAVRRAEKEAKTMGTDWVSSSQVAHIIDKEYAPAIVALRLISADDDDNPWELVAKRALYHLGIPVEEESDE